MLKRILGIFIIIVVSLPLLCIQYVYWELFNKSSENIDRFMDYIHYNFLHKK